jgi:hypothetical protein
MSVNEIPLNKILFLDIETVPQYPSFKKVPANFKELWSTKAEHLDKEKKPDELYPRAGIYAEFGKIICISLGFVHSVDNKNVLRLKSLYGDDEKDILIRFFELLNQKFNGSNHYLCGHNGKEFDFPYIARRAIVHRLKLPKILDITGCKPWEVRHLDTMELWRFGDYKNFTSLNLLASIFDIPSPKDDISGKDVHKVYYEEKDLPRIVTYCQKDVISLVQIYLRYRGDDVIPDENISIIE